MTVAQRSAIFSSSKRHSTKPWNCIFWPDAVWVKRQMFRYITLSPSGTISSMVTCKGFSVSAAPDLFSKLSASSLHQIKHIPPTWESGVMVGVGTMTLPDVFVITR